MYDKQAKMSAPSRLNKENFRLLDLSSEEESEDLQLEIIPGRKKKITRRDRSRGVTTNTSEPNIRTEVQCAVRWAVNGTLLLWMIMLTWICAALYDQMSTMRMEFNRVSTSSEGVGDALQFCHTAAKELRANATSLNARLEKLELEHKDLLLKVKSAEDALAAVSEQLSAAPKLADTPRRLAELQRTVADFGSQINGFDGALSSAKKQAVTAASGVEEVRTLLRQLDARTNETIANLTSSISLEENTRNSLVELNTTLVSKVEALRTRIEEISAKRNQPQSPIAPASTSVPASRREEPAPIAVTLSTSSTTAQPPVAPVKPNILA